jgi:hypothetical protein
MTEYDSWLDSLIPDPPPDPRVIELAVPCDFGAFNWQVFTKRYSQGCVPDWAWERCKKGPFITPYARLAFAIHLACARIRLLFVKHSSRWHPLVLASHTARYLIDEDYLEATTEVESAWSAEFCPWTVRAEEQEDGGITIYGRECDDYSFDF